MVDIPFHLTMVGKRFFESTPPALVAAIEMLNKNLERLTAAGAARKEPPRAGDAPGLVRGHASVS